jgi:TPR repeat protein
MKFCRNVAVLIAWAGVVVLIVLWSHHRHATHWSTIRMRAEQGDARAQFHLAAAYYLGRGDPQNYAEALRWYRMAADQGESDAEDGLGYMYVTGRGAKQDYAEALRWYKRAAEHGSAKGQFDLATVYDDGIGVPPDYVEASRWFRKAAEQNYAKAQDGLGYMYYAGRGLPQDYAQAFFWYRKAAEQGYAKAEFDLSSMYYNGLGTSQDHSEARRWCIKAAKQGNADAQQALAVLVGASDTVTKFEYLELVPSLVLGSWVLLDFLFRGRKHLDLRNVALLLLGLSSLAISGMNIYVIAHGGLGYCTYPVAFRIVKRVLIGTACLIIVTVVLPAKKLNALPRTT